MTLDDPRWKHLEGGYRVAYNPMGALRRFEAGEVQSDIWRELGNELHHQGDVGIASYATIPQLVDLQRRTRKLDWNLYALAATIEGALGALEDYLRAQALSRHPDPHIVRIVLRSGEQLQAKIRHADPDELTLTDLPPHGATRRIRAIDIAQLAIALPAPGRWIKVALGTLVIGGLWILATALLRSRLNSDALVALLVLGGVAALFVWDRADKPGSKLLPWVVTFSEQVPPN